MTNAGPRANVATRKRGGEQPAVSLSGQVAAALLMNHNDILAEFKRLGLTEGQGMMLLAESNTISDNCIRVMDIGYRDIPAAVHWLKSRKPD